MSGSLQLPITPATGDPMPLAFMNICAHVHPTPQLTINQTHTQQKSWFSVKYFTSSLRLRTSVTNNVDIPLNTWNVDSVIEELSVLCVWAGDGSQASCVLTRCFTTWPGPHISSFICFLNVLTNIANSAEAGSLWLTGKVICRLSLKLGAMIGFLAKDPEVERSRFI